MQSSRRPKTTLLESERHSLEFTSGQLIIAICGLLFLWLVGFLMGVMAGRLEFGSALAKAESPGAANHATAKNDPKTPPKPPASSDKAPAEKEKARVTDIPAPPAPKPAPVAAKPAEPKPAEPKAAEAKAAEEKKSEGGPKYVTERPDRPTLAATQTQAEAAAPAEPAAAQTPSAPPTVVAKAETPVEAPKTEAAEKTAEKTAEKPKEETAKEAEAPKENSLKKGGKSYTVQLFSVKAENRSNADEYVTLLKQNSGLSGEVVKSKDGKHFNVVIGRYPDRKAAEAKRDELKKKAGFADCIVREIS